MDRNDVAAILGRERSCRSVDRAMSVVSQGYDLVAVWEGGREADLAGAEREHPGASLVVLAKGLSPSGDRLGVFRPTGWTEPRMF
jgi:hypothetical protein